jgi:tRNA threonylcarbamoyladenosine modification (KEOPS) complex  Pcc1 subunit
VTYAITAQDTTTVQNWTVTVSIAAPSNNADLFNLLVSEGTLDPVFSSAVTSYAVAVANSISSIIFTPTAAEPATATITVDGVAVASGVASDPVSLNTGTNPIAIVVTAEDGTTIKTYTVTVTRAVASSNADLSGLSVSAGTLVPVFASGTFSYTVAVDNSVDTTTVTPTAADGTATIKVNGVEVASGVASASIDLGVGANSISIVVTAEDLTTKTYTVIISVALNDDATLSDLTVDGTTITGFDPATLSYSKVLIYGTTDIPEVLATLTDADASMVITQATNVNGTEEERTATILVTAEDGTTTKTYKVIFGSISVTITKTGPTTANQGDDITYTITYKNEGIILNLIQGLITNGL